MQTHNHRQVDVDTGRWLNPDPLGLGPDTNPYRFVGNGPTNAADPSGLDPVPGDTGYVPARPPIPNDPWNPLTHNNPGDTPILGPLPKSTSRIVEAPKITIAVNTASDDLSNWKNGTWGQPSSFWSLQGNGASGSIRRLSGPGVWVTMKHKGPFVCNSVAHGTIGGKGNTGAGSARIYFYTTKRASYTVTIRYEYLVSSTCVVDATFSLVDRTRHASGASEKVISGKGAKRGIITLNFNSVPYRGSGCRVR
jgi:hypothetical protein